MVSGMDPIYILGFLTVWIRLGVFMAVSPIFGHSLVPPFVKVFTSFAVALGIFPTLVHTGTFPLEKIALWGLSPFGLFSTCFVEVLVGLWLGFISKLVFDGVLTGAHIMGTSMGFAIASSYDPHQESQTIVIAEIQMVLVTLLFLSMDGHHLLLNGIFISFKEVGVGDAVITPNLFQSGVEWIRKTFWIAIQLSAPMAFVMLILNLIFGLISRALPQLNLLALSLGFSAMAGLFVLMTTQADWMSVSNQWLAQSQDWLKEAMRLLHG